MSLDMLSLRAFEIFRQMLRRQLFILLGVQRVM